jgi:hypothetical protein
MSELPATSDFAPRPNMMTREDFLHRILHSGEITKIGQHLALVIFLLAEGNNQLHTSVRDLERITGWSKSMISDHLDELRIFMRMHFGTGRAKTLFELQGVIEDALATAVVSATRTRTPDLASASRTQDETSVRQPDATVDASATRTQEQRVASASRTQIDDPKKKGLPHTPSKEKTHTHTGSECGDGGACEADATGVRVNGVAIYGPDFTLDYKAIDLAAGTIGMPKDRARALAEVCARDWAANGKKPEHPMGLIRAALRNELNRDQIDDARLAKAKGPAPPTKTFRR